MRKPGITSARPRVGLHSAISIAAVGLGVWAAIMPRSLAQQSSNGSPAAAKTSVRLNRVIEKLADGQTVVGTFPGAANSSVSAARTLSASNNDFVMFDLQYGVFDVRAVQMQMLAMIDKAGILKKGSLQPNVIPLARIPESTHDNPQFAVKQLLDIGVFGIMFPHIESKEQAEAAVRMMRYPGRNGTSFDHPGSGRGTPVDAMWFWGLSEPEYMRRADVWPLNPEGELLTIAQIESAAGVQHLDEILQVPGIGAILIGPSHLSQSLGEPSWTSPKTEGAVQTVLKGCLAKRIPCGYPVVGATAEAAQRDLAKRKEEGFRFLTINVNGR